LAGRFDIGLPGIVLALERSRVEQQIGRGRLAGEWVHEADGIEGLASGDAFNPVGSGIGVQLRRRPGGTPFVTARLAGQGGVA
jgi:hypothetical protein